MQELNKNIKVIISGGGTGGHVYPAIAIANALKKINPEISILFVGAIGKMEMQKVPAAGYTIEGLWISGFQRKLTMRNFGVPFKIIASMLKSWRILNKFKPNVVVGVGGYASGPMLKLSALKSIPTLIQEQNSFPGITNRMLSKKANKICVAYPGMEKFFQKEKIILTGNPVRQDIAELQNKKVEALKYFNLSSEKKVLLILGGSLGAKRINETVRHSLNVFAENNVQVIWQTGKIYFDQLKVEAESMYDKGIRVFDFIEKMDFAYTAADLVISRAGAISISEICAAAKPAILIPSPNVAEDHQTKNAMMLEQNNAAVLVKDNEVPEKLDTTVLSLITDEVKMKTLSENIKKLAIMDSAERIAKEIIQLAENNKN